MAKNKVSRTRYTDAFKRRAIQRVESGSITQAALARELGIAAGSLHGWRHSPLAQSTDTPVAKKDAPTPTPAAKITRTQYSDDFKRRAAGRLMAGEIGLVELARETGVDKKLLGRWRRQQRGAPTQEPPSPGPDPLPAAPAAGDLSMEALYALVGRLTVENQMLRQRLSDR